MATAVPARLVVVMGVSGCGKSTVGKLLARRIGAEFLEGDALHPPRNVERMAAGIALTDNDRRDWLLEIAQQLADAHASKHALVVSCSALKRSYRNMLRTASNDLAFVHIHAEFALLEQRMRARQDHYMPASLLESQVQTLEPPGADERAVTFDAALAPEQIAAQAATWLATLQPSATGARR
jgi:gluconokinase